MRKTTSMQPSTASRTMKGKTQDVFQSIVNSRKSYKMLKGNTEAVWPPYLEEAMLKGFESYQPEDCRETRLLGRFPMRNQFISEFIFRATGKRRSAKQVGSRLQQLRDTYEGKRLLAQLSSHYNLGGKPLSSSASFTSESSENPSIFDAPNSPSSSHSSFQQQSPPSTPLDITPERRTFVRIDILPPDVSPSCTGRPSEGPPSPVFSSNGVTDVFRPSSLARPICSIDPTVTLVAQSLIAAQSMCTVLHDGALIHEENTELALVGPCDEGRSNVDGALLYGVKLIPKFWDRICQSPDPTRFTIVQKVTRVPSCASQSSTEEDSAIFSALYHFSYPPGEYVRRPSTGLTTPPQESVSTNTYFSYHGWEGHEPTGYAGSPITEQHSAHLNSGAQPNLMLDTHAPQPFPSFSAYNFTGPTTSLLPEHLDNYVV